MKVCVVLTARPSYTKLKPILEALKARPEIELQVVVGCSALLERYGAVANTVTSDGFQIAAEAWTVLEGENLLTGARETGLAMLDFASIYDRLQPDVVVVMADRREILAAAAAAKYQHIALAHCQGGEKTGSIDDFVRDAVTQLADYHFVATERAKYRVYALTGRWDRIYRVGCSSIDLARRALDEPPVTREELGGHGSPLDLNRPFLVVLQHAVSEEACQAGEQMKVTLQALVGWPVVLFWPGQDAGAGEMSKAIRVWMDEHPERAIHTVRSLPPIRFLRLLRQASCLVGNSSAGIRECSYLGVPVVNIGTRQHGRERGLNVVDVPHDVQQIAWAIQRQVQQGPYPSCGLYGSGDAGEQIAGVICGITKAKAEGSSVC